MNNYIRIIYQTSSTFITVVIKLGKVEEIEYWIGRDGNSSERSLFGLSEERNLAILQINVCMHL
jgi:hypothetical protein